MVFLRGMVNPVVVVVLFVVLVILMSGAAGSVHVGRIEHNAVNRRFSIRQSSAVNTGRQVSGTNIVGAGRNTLPEDPFAVGDIRNYAASRHMQSQNMRKHLIVGSLVSREDELIGCNPARGSAGLLRSNDHGSLADHDPSILLAQHVSCDQYGLPRPSRRERGE